MEAYQLRVVDERRELCDKITKLQTFLASDKLKTLPEDEQSRLKMQCHAMCLYAEILSARIAAFR